MEDIAFRLCMSKPFPVLPSLQFIFYGDKLVEILPQKVENITCRFWKSKLYVSKSFSASNFHIYILFRPISIRGNVIILSLKENGAKLVQSFTRKETEENHNFRTLRRARHCASPSLPSLHHPLPAVHVYFRAVPFTNARVLRGTSTLSSLSTAGKLYNCIFLFYKLCFLDRLWFSIGDNQRTFVV